MNEIDKIAVAALLHDIGKFGQRADVDIQKDSYDFQEYCPMKFDSYWTHQHSAYTADFLKTIVGKQGEFNFIDTLVGDESFENISAKHHKPNTSKEWLVAIADRVASGFEREEFDKYNNSDDRKNKSLNYFEVPLDSIFSDNKKFDLIEFDSNSILASNIQKHSKEKYKKLWDKFEQDLNILKKKPKTNFISGLDFLLKKYTSFIPSSTYGTKANIPLYDHLKTTSAFASALTKFHENDMTLENIKDYQDKKFLLVAGDFFGIQNFIFSDIPTSKASKILRGKSAFIQIFIKIIALDICKNLGISHLSIITTSAGKFEILAPNTEETKIKLNKMQETLNNWFIKNTFGESGIGMSFLEASCDDFTSGKFHNLREDLSKKVEITKYKKFNLINFDPILNNDKNITKDNEHQCKICKKRFKDNTDNDKACDFCNIFIKLGEKLAKANYIKINNSTKGINIFEDYYIDLLEDEPYLHEDNIIYDISNSEEFKGFDKWALKSYVKFSESEDRVEEFEELSMESCGGEDRGVKALMALKGDVDNMGDFLSKSNINSFAKYNFISRLIDYFFSVKVSKMMGGKNLYTIFAGGDDLFIIGAWDEIIEISKQIRYEFMKFVEGSPLSFSVGMVMFKSSKPINFIADISEKALEDAKAMDGKDAITLFDETVKWEDYLDDLGLYDELDKTNPNTAFTYRLLELIDMSKHVKYDNDVLSTIWKSKLAYSFKRNMAENDKPLLNTLNEMIEDYPKEAKMKVSEFIYKRRD